MQAETQTKMSILGRSSMRDRKKEEELRNSDDPTHQHLKDDLHVLVQSEPPFSSSKLAAGVAEVKKMLIPLVSVVCAIECCTVNREYFIFSDSLAYAKIKCVKIHAQY